MKMFLILLALTIPTINGCATCDQVIGARYHPETKVIEYVFSNSPAERAGIMVGDTILGNDGQKWSILHCPTKDTCEMMIYTLVPVCVDTLRNNWPKF